jgi:hypothetical protein
MPSTLSLLVAVQLAVSVLLATVPVRFIMAYTSELDSICFTGYIRDALRRQCTYLT